MNILSLISLDPGKAGGIAWTMNAEQCGEPACLPMPDTQGQTLAVIRSFAKASVELQRSPVAYLEQVGGFIRPSNNAKNSAAAHTMFTFGENFGFLKGCLQALGIRLVLVHPKKWQKHFSLGAKKDCATPREWKAKLAAEAARRFPTANVSRATADALLILDYARAQETRPL